MLGELSGSKDEVRQAVEHALAWHKPADPQVKTAMEVVRDRAMSFVDVIVELMPACAERERALWRLIEAKQEAIAGLARFGVSEDG